MTDDRATDALYTSRTRLSDPKCGGDVAWLGCGATLHWERHWDTDPLVAIRCLDCGAVLCPACARKHFATDEKDKKIDGLLKGLREALTPLVNGADVLAVCSMFEGLRPEARAEIERWEHRARVEHMHLVELMGCESRTAPARKGAP